MFAIVFPSLGGAQQMVGGTEPEQPDGQSEVLAWVRGSHVSTALTVAAATVAFFFFGRSGGPVPQLNSVWIWLVYSSVVGAIVYSTWHPVLSAGASWVQMGRNWVETYDLVRIDAGSRGRRRYVLRMEDSSGRRVRGFPCWIAQRDRQLWGLVRAGILDSVSSGRCDITPAARRVLDIPLELVVNEQSVRREKSEQHLAVAVTMIVGVVVLVAGIADARVLGIVIGGVLTLVPGWLTYGSAKRWWARRRTDSVR